MPVFAIASVANIHNATRGKPPPMWSVGPWLPQNNTGTTTHDVSAMACLKTTTNKCLFVSHSGVNALNTDIGRNFSFFDLGAPYNANSPYQSGTHGTTDGRSSSRFKKLTMVEANGKVAVFGLTLDREFSFGMTNTGTGGTVSGGGIARYDISSSNKSWGQYPTTMTHSTSNYIQAIRVWTTSSTSATILGQVGGSYTTLGGWSMSRFSLTQNWQAYNITNAVQLVVTPTSATIQGIIPASAINSTNPTVAPAYVFGTSLISGSNPRVAYHDGTANKAFVPLGTNANTGPSNGAVDAMATKSDYTMLYVCGSFTKINSDTANAYGIAVYDVALKVWSPLNICLATVSPAFTDIAVAPSGNVYVACGSMPPWTNLGVTVNRIVMYNPSTATWASLGVGVNGPCTCLVIYDEETLFVGGSFTRVNTAEALPTTSGMTAYGLAMWSGGLL